VPYSCQKVNEKLTSLPTDSNVAAVILVHLVGYIMNTIKTAALASVLSLFASGANAAVVSFLTEFTGADVDLQATVEDDGDGVTISLLTDPFGTGVIGDIRAFFFSFDGFDAGDTYSITGSDVTSFDASGGVTSLGGSLNLNGGGGSNPGSFDIGVEFGSSGIGADDITSTVFSVSVDGGTISSADFLNSAARITSVGLLGGDREDSSKLSGGFDPVDPPSEVPLPAGGWLLLAGLGAFAAVRRKAS